MGTWAVDAFGNDDAVDWIDELVETDDLEMIEAALTEAVELGGDYLDSETGTIALAAAEVVARLLGHVGIENSYSEAVDEWVESTELKPSAALVKLARRAVDRVRTEPSELLELWAESEDLEAWQASIADLRQRLSV